MNFALKNTSFQQAIYASNVYTRITTNQALDSGSSISVYSTISTGQKVMSRGVVWSVTNIFPTIDDNKQDNAGVGEGSFTTDITNDLPPFGPSVTVYIRTYCQLPTGYLYSATYSVSYTPICIAKGTLVKLSDGTDKKVEDITYEDILAVWNFDTGAFDSAKPLWIKTPQTTSCYNILEFSNGSSLATISDHRIYNSSMGKFSYLFLSDEMPIGSTTFSISDYSAGEFKSSEIQLTNKYKVNEPMEYYNIITDNHINIFTNNILTSNRYNNLYAINNMKYVKDNREHYKLSDFPASIPIKYITGLRLLENTTIPIDETVQYVKRMIALEAIIP